MKYLLLFYLIFLITSRPISAQNPQWLVYNTENSPLPSDYVVSFIEDNQHNFWIGTFPQNNSSGGLAKFNGTNWTIYNTSNSPLPSNYIQHLVSDKQKSIWIATTEGVAIFDGANWTILDTSNSGLPTNDILYIALEDNGTKWFGTYQRGLVKYDDTNWTIYNRNNSGLPHDEVNIIVIDHSGNKWIGTDGGGLVKFDGTNWTKYSQENFLKGFSAVMGFAIDSQQDNWVTALGDSITTMAKFNDTTYTLFGDSTIGFHLSVTFGGIAIDSNDTKWIATNDGLAKYDDSDWIVYDTNNSPLPSDWISALMIDNYDNKWMGLFTGEPEFSGAGLALFNEDGVSIPTDILQTGPSFSPSKVRLSQNYPNPFNGITNIGYSIPFHSWVTLKVFDITGRKVAELVNNNQTPGNYEVVFDSANLSSGIYFYQLLVNDLRSTQNKQMGLIKKITLIK